MKLEKLLKKIYAYTTIIITLDSNQIYYGTNKDFNESYWYDILKKYKIMVITPIIYYNVTCIEIHLQLNFLEE